MNEIEDLREAFNNLSIEVFRIIDKQNKYEDLLIKLKEYKKPELKLMDFSEALKAMKQGKKVRIAGWLSDQYVYIKNGNFFDEKARQFESICFESVLSNDWHIVE